MKNSFKIFTAFYLILTVCLSGACGIFAYTAPVSPALDIIAEDMPVVMTSSLPEGIVFSREDFDEAVGVEKVTEITVSALPDVSSGVLYLGNVPIMKNQTISRTNFDMIKFVPLSKTAEGSFTYTAKSAAGSRDITCALYVLDRENTAPVTDFTGTLYTDITTYAGIDYYGSLKVSDPENDPLVYRTVSAPQNGTLVITDKQNGSYCYIPNEDFSGEDSFVFCAYDKYGLVSDDVTVNISVRENSENLVFADMAESWAYASAIRAAECGLMSGSYNGTSFNFNPGQNISRCEFLALAMTAAGYETDSISAVTTSFADDSEIPKKYKGCVAIASQLGIINGIPDGDSVIFAPNKELTRAEAAVILNNILNIEADGYKTVFADRTSIPAWAEGAIYALNSQGILLGTGGGYISPYSYVSRAQTAQILCMIMDLSK